MDAIKDVLSKVGDLRGGSAPGAAQFVQPAPAGLCRPDCPVCNGSGWIRRERPVGDPLFGRMEYCPNVDLFKINQSRIGIEPEDRSLDWDAIDRVNGVDRAIDAIAAALDRGFGWVTVWGSYGLAKTLLLKTAVAVWTRSGRLGSYSRMVDLIDYLKGAYNPANPADEDIRRLDYLSDVPLLCVDEFDRVRQTEFVQDRKFALLDRRYSDACYHRSVTILTSNADPDKFEGYLRSRIFDARFAVVYLQGEDYRLVADWGTR